ncbi:zinc-finger homeodomain protein 4-like [Durio zibethinus]|uniref:Zinc-finger homeodomain protein 4-like n=1 Tax=Durio zibethinus TaxID=66656 RepID=A0A6P5YEV5_DURZI|nr:zinc-finger homeodomain protein 4-like [Durio zibethinus]
MEKEYPHDLYKECLRNHAASLGSYATDGCGEFTLDKTYPSTLQCAACGCHRNFHRKVSHCSSSRSRGDPENTVELIAYGDGGGSGGKGPVTVESTKAADRSGKKRFRTKFTTEQKEKMLGFAEKLGWKLQRRDEEDEVEKFCRAIGVSRQVFKVWMHNHKNSSSASSVSTYNASSLTTQ